MSNEEKLCLKCQELKSLDNFQYRISHNGKYYYRSPCKACVSNRVKPYSRKYREDNKVAVNEGIKESTRKARERDPEGYARRRKDIKLRSFFGITIETFEGMKAKQNNCCYICGEHENNLKRKLFVDHCHSSGKVRKLLCSACNMCLGFSKEDPQILQRMIEYVREHEHFKTEPLRNSGPNH